MPRVLLCGGTSMVAQSIVEQLSEASWSTEDPLDLTLTYFANAQTAEVRASSVAQGHAVSMDITDADSVAKVVAKAQPQVVINCVVVQAGLCEQKPDLAQAVNCDGVATLLAQLPPNTHFINLSTDLVLDGEHAPYDEDAECAPVTVYGATKRAAELLVSDSASSDERVSSNAMTVSLRCALVVGTGGYAKWVHTHLVNWLQAGDDTQPQPISLFADEYRTPAYSRDIARTVLRLIQSPLHPSISLLNCSGPERINRVDFARLMLAAIRPDDDDATRDALLADAVTETKLADFSTGYPRPRDVSLDTTLLQSLDLGLTTTPLAQACQELHAQWQSSSSSSSSSS